MISQFAAKQIFECVMNVSEGRDRIKLQAIAAEIQAVPDAYLLEYSADFDHHRSVFTFTGTCESIFEAAFAAIERVVTLIDLRIHRGVHPRLGAVDVVPFVPIQGVGLKDCAEIAHRLGAKVAKQLGVPVYLYEEAAICSERKTLPDIRRRGFEAVSREIGTDLLRKPDFGSARLHPTAGATVIGARRPLIAFNLYLNTPDVGVARNIAARIRETRGGLPAVRSLGFYISRRNQAQVSVNLLDYRRNSLNKVYERVSEEAHRLNLDVLATEIIGLVPQEAMDRTDLSSLKLENFSPSRILEKRIGEVLG